MFYASTIFAQQNYCDDDNTNNYWRKLKLNSGDDISIVELVEYREKLCVQVASGKLSLREASELFGYERARVLDKLEKGSD